MLENLQTSFLGKVMPTAISLALWLEKRVTYVSQSLEKEVSSHMFWEVKRELPWSTSANVSFVLFTIMMTMVLSYNLGVNVQAPYTPAINKDDFSSVPHG